MIKPGPMKVEVCIKQQKMLQKSQNPTTNGNSNFKFISGKKEKQK